MTETQRHALVMLYLGYIACNTPYSTSDLRIIYISRQIQIDAVFANAPLLGLVIQTYVPLLPQVIITDPNQSW